MAFDCGHSDSVDALMYAYYVTKRIKEENHVLEKNKDYIEFLMHSMMTTHKPYEGDVEITMTGKIPERDFFVVNNPFDIPCDVVVVPKKDFEALQTENEQLKKKLQEFDVTFALSLFWKREYKTLSNNIMKWKKATGCSTPEEAKEFIDNKKRRIIELNDELDNSQSAVDEAYDRITEMEDLCMEYRDQIRTLRTEYEQAKAAIRYYKARIGNAIQAASCAVKHLDTIGYTDPIKED